MRSEFNTTEYEMSAGHSPRGRGAWGFEVHCQSQEQRAIILDPQFHGVVRAEAMQPPGRASSHKGEWVRIWTRGGTTFSEAKAQVKLFLRGHFKDVIIFVCP